MFTLNVGCMYVRSTERSVDLMARVNHRLLTASVGSLFDCRIGSAFNGRKSALNLHYTVILMMTMSISPFGPVDRGRPYRSKDMLLVPLGRDTECFGSHMSLSFILRVITITITIAITTVL
jgi:hypothetical protein